MAENKTGPNIGAGAGFLAKRVQKSLNRAQEKVMQKLGKTMETKDEQFEQCSQNLIKQQTDGGRLSKDVKAYFNAVKAMHETSKRLSQTLRDVYEPEWQGGEDLSVIMQSEDLLWNDFEEKLTDQIVRTMENYTSQFLEVKERMAKRGRKLVDYDSSRHHLEALQNAKKKDEAKITKAEEEFNKAQSVFEEINKELREELPVLHQSRIGCYVTVFQNISNLRDVFYKEMSVLNHELYNVMKKLETQHSGKAFIIKGLNTTKSKKRKSLVISAPIPCNTAFPADHASLHSSAQNGKEADAPSLGENTKSISEEPTLASEGMGVPTVTSETSDSDELSSNDPNTPKRQSVCDSVNSDRSDATAEGLNLTESVTQEEHGSSQSGDSSTVEVQTEKSEVTGGDEATNQEAPLGSTDSHIPHTEEESTPVPPRNAETKPLPVPAPRLSFSPVESSVVVGEGEGTSPNKTTTGNASASKNPPGFLYKAVAVESHASEDGLLQFEKGDVILVLAETVDKQEGMLNGVREESWNQHGDLADHSGFFMEKLIQPVESD